MLSRCSIVTVNYNNREGLRKTIESVSAQLLDNFEYIVVDGGSDDGSKELIEAHSEVIDHWVSERDSGIYNAMNKGVKAAHGEYVLFLNSGDYFFNEESLGSLLETKNSHDLIYGNLVVDAGNEKRIKRYPDALTFGYFLKDTLPHPATLIKKDLLLSNPFNEENRIVSDWEFFLTAVCKLNASYAHVDLPVTVFDRQGLSSRPDNQSIIVSEKSKFLERHFARFLDDYQEAEKLRTKLQERSFKSMVRKIVNYIRPRS
jgi:glycosyltransferase involved in cell wall biosynthesis